MAANLEVDLATLADLKERMNPREGDIEEALLQKLLTSASERVTDLSGRRFLRTPAVTVEEPDPDPITLEAWAGSTTWCQAFDLRQVEVISADGADVTAECQLVRTKPEHPAHGIVLPHQACRVEITGHFGFASVPFSIEDATLGWAQRAYHEIRARMADSTIDPEGAVQNYFRSVPPFVSGPVNKYRIKGT